MAKVKDANLYMTISMRIVLVGSSKWEFFSSKTKVRRKFIG
jgi:hypothetical protein